MHFTPDVGKPKLQSAEEKIKAINPHVKFIPYHARFTSENAMQIAQDQDWDLIIDGTDNFPTRYLVNDVCVLLNKPNVYGSIFRFEGQATVFWAEKGPCYRCLYPEPPPPGLVPSCAEGGVLGVICGIIGCVQVNEAIKLILGRGNPLIGRLLLFNAMEMKFKELKLRKDPNCPICGKNPTITELIDYEQFCGLGRGEEETQPGADMEIDVKTFKKMIDRGEKPVIIDVREPHEYDICKIDGSKLIPLGEVPNRMNEIPKDKPVVIHCHSGGRSMKAVQFLAQQGYTNCKNLAGGIDEWSAQIDPSVARY
jgi:adenylyltransferase/sulfurtransferase